MVRASTATSDVTRRTTLAASSQTSFMVTTTVPFPSVLPLVLPRTTSTVVPSTTVNAGAVTRSPIRRWMTPTVTSTVLVISIRSVVATASTTKTTVLTSLSLETQMAEVILLLLLEDLTLTLVSVAMEALVATLRPPTAALCPTVSPLPRRL